MNNVIISENFDYDALAEKKAYGFYSQYRLNPNNNSSTSVLQPNTQTDVNFTIPISFKAVKMNSIKLVLRGNVQLLAQNANNTLSHIGVASDLSPISRYELKTKSGQTIQRHENIRSYAYTKPDRANPKQSREEFNHCTFVNSDYTGANQLTSASAKYILNGYFHGTNTDEATVTAYNNAALSDDALNKGRNGWYYTMGTLAANQAGFLDLAELTWSIYLADIFDGIFSTEVDLLLPNDSLELTLSLDSSAFIKKTHAAGGDIEQCAFALKEAYIKFLYQEDAEINKYLKSKIDNGGYLLYPYEHINTNTQSSAYNTAATIKENITINNKLFNNAGSLLRKIYITFNYINSVAAGYKYRIFRNYKILDKIRLDINSTLIAEIDWRTYDNVKGLDNNLLFGYNALTHRNGYFVGVYFSDPINSLSKMDGLVLSPSSVYNIMIEREAPDKLPNIYLTNGNISYEVHIVTTKLLYINSSGAVVLNSINETPLQPNIQSNVAML